MIFLNAWIFFTFIPLYFIFSKHKEQNNVKQIILLYISLTFMLIAFARPAIQNTVTNEKFKANDYIIAIDASYSMQADDLKPTRYILAKEAISKLIKMHPQDRFTLFAFTSNTLLISPPTTDTQISMQALNALNPEYILTKSTNLYNLFKTIAKLQMKQKNLIIFSDGGDQHQISDLVRISKKSNIIPYFIATATQKGAALKKGDSYLKDVHSALVISRINPILKDIAELTHGKYYELDETLSIINTLSNDLQKSKDTKDQTVKVKTYNELFYIPLAIAIIIYIIAITKIHQIILLLPLFVFLPQKSDASVLDFYHLHKAQTAYIKSDFLVSAKEFSKLSPSVSSYYNSATAYYKSGHYKKAIQYYTQIKTTDETIKQKLLYNIANCAFKLKKYNKAKILYQEALAFSEDKDALYNLNLIKTLHLITSKDVKDMMPKKENTTPKKKKKKNSSSHSKKQKKDNKGSSNNSNSSSQNSTNGKSSNKKKKYSASFKKSKDISNYRLPYKAYEKINKGYSDEKEPW